MEMVNKMLKKTNLILSIILLFLLCGFLSAQEAEHSQSAKKTYTLDELYTIALERAERIKISENELFITEKDEDRAFSLHMPTVRAFGDYTKYSESNMMQPESSRTWGITAEQAFTVNGKALHGLSIAKDRVAKGKYDLMSAKEGYLFEVAFSYYNTLKAARALEIADTSVERLDTHKSAVIKLQELKEVPKTALFRAEAELSFSITEQVYAKNHLRLMRAQLASLVDLPPDFELSPPDLNETDLDDIKLDKLKEEAFSGRADLLSADIEKKVSGTMVKYIKSSYWPVITLGAGYTETEVDSSEDSFFDPETESLYGNINISVALYDGGLRGADVEQALARKKQAELLLKERRKQIAVEVEEAYLNLSSTRQILGAFEDQLKSARENYSAVSQQFKYGLSGSLDVMDANMLLVQSEREFVNAQYDLKLSVLNLTLVKGSFLKSIGL